MSWKSIRPQVNAVEEGLRWECCGSIGATALLTAPDRSESAGRHQVRFSTADGDRWRQGQDIAAWAAGEFARFRA